MLQMNLITLRWLLLAGCTLVCVAQVDVDLGKADFPTNPATVPQDAPKMTPPTTPSTTSTTKSTTTTTTTTTQQPPVPTNTTTAKPTTAKPTTPTTAKPTTPAPSPPYPKPSVGTWNSSCIMAKMAAQLNFTYETIDNKTATALYNIPVDDVKVEDSQCEGQTQTLHLVWGPPEAIHSALLNFENVNETVKLSMLKYVLPITNSSFPDAKNETIQLIHRGNEFGVPVKMSYHCTRAQTLNLTQTIPSNVIHGTVTLYDVQLEAFRTNTTGSGFSKARDCDSSTTYDMVPWAVGITLAALIAIVLIAYLAARHRSTSRGYMSF